jgi:cytosine/adenosine deaminase-related metal-dependent hydrolase
VVEDEGYILKESQRLIEQYHDPNPGAYVQIVLAPCSPFSVTPDLMRNTAALAREYGVNLHTHLAETEDEEAFCLDQFGYKPVAYMDVLNWIGSDVWFAHSVHVDNEEIKLYGQTGCGVAHCPTSNMRLASGIAPIIEMILNGVNVGLGVDGSASNDSSNLLAETRQAMLLSRVRSGLMGASLSSQDALPLMTARQAVEIATLGGAAVLGRDAVNLNQLEYTGALHDPIAALVFCSPVKADFTSVGGKLVVKDGELITHDVNYIIEKHNEAVNKLLDY